jgi:hypothetical protein
VAANTISIIPMMRKERAAAPIQLRRIGHEQQACETEQAD